MPPQLILISVVIKSTNESEYVL